MTSAAHDHDWPDWTDDDDAWSEHQSDCFCGEPGLDDAGPDDDFPTTPGTFLVEPDDVLDALLPLIGPERAGPMALWCLLVDAEDRTLPLVMPIGDIPMRPDGAMVHNLVRMLDVLLDEHAPDGGVVFAVVRRAGGDRGEVEQVWARSLETVCLEVGVRLRAICAVGRDRARVLRW